MIGSAEMESVDLFATKGIEYLIVIGYLVMLVIFWRLFRVPVGMGAVRRAVPRAAAAVGRWFDVRDGYFFHQGHTWALPDAEERETVRVGMDDFAGRLIGRPDAIALPGVGERLRQGERGWEISAAGASIPMLAPVDGEVVAVNDAVLERPELASREPYENGWLLEVRVDDRGRLPKNLLSGRLARQWMETVAEGLRLQQVGDLGYVLPDGGTPIDGFARALAPDRWDELARELLLSD